jgi:hypothetical protein
MATYPDTGALGYSLSRAEITLNGAIYTAITNVSIDQPTEEGAIEGTSPYPLGRSAGTMGIGEGTITFSDEESRLEFIDALGDGYRDVLWPLTYVLRKTDGTTKKIECISCRVLSNPIDHAKGADALGGDIAFSFLNHKINGKSPHLP